MGKNDDLPDFHAKRKILFGDKTSDEQLRETGQQFMEGERYDDALEFFQRADADDLARQVARNAMERGNTPLYMRAKRVLGEPISEDEWVELARSAERAELYTAARLAYQKAGRTQEAERLAELIFGPEEEDEAVEEEAAEQG